MDTADSLLSSLGLTGTEIALYRAGLAVGAVGVAELVRRTRIKRPTVYHAMGTLMQKGLAAKRGTAKRITFVMTPPDRIGALLDRQMEAITSRKASLASLIPLLATSAAGEARTEVVQYEGVEGVKLAVEEALYCRTRKWDIIAPRRNFFSDFDAAYARYFLQARRGRGIIVRSLWEFDPSRRVLTAEEMRQRDPRILPEIMHGAFSSVIILFDDAVAIIMSAENLSAIVVHSPEIRQTIGAMFEGLWSVSEPYERRMRAVGRRNARPAHE